MALRINTALEASNTSTAWYWSNVKFLTVQVYQIMELISPYIFILFVPNKTGLISVFIYD